MLLLCFSVELAMNFEFKFLIIELENLINNSNEQITRLCNLLELHCGQHFLSRAKQGLLSKPNPTRNGVNWTPAQIDAIESLNKTYLTLMKTMQSS